MYGKLELCVVGWISGPPRPVRSADRAAAPLAYNMAYMAAMIAVQHDNFRPLLEETMNSTSLSELSEATQQAAQILRSPICCDYP